MIGERLHNLYLPLCLCHYEHINININIAACTQNRTSANTEHRNNKSRGVVSTGIVWIKWMNRIADKGLAPYVTSTAKLNIWDCLLHCGLPTLPIPHNDVMVCNCLSHYWPFVEETHRWIPVREKGHNAELWSFGAEIPDKRLNNSPVAGDLRRHDAHLVSLQCIKNPIILFHIRIPIYLYTTLSPSISILIPTLHHHPYLNNQRTFPPNIVPYILSSSCLTCFYGQGSPSLS